MTQTLSRDYTMKEWARINFRVIFWNLKSSSFESIASILNLLASFMPKFGHQKVTFWSKSQYFPTLLITWFWRHMATPNFLKLAYDTIYIIISKTCGRTSLHLVWFVRNKPCKIVKKTIPPYRISYIVFVFVYRISYIQYDVFLSLAPGKTVCGGTIIFSELHHMYLSTTRAHFGDPTSMIRWVLRRLKMAIFDYSLQFSITTWQAGEHFFIFQILKLASLAYYYAASWRVFFIYF